MKKTIMWFLIAIIIYLIAGSSIPFVKQLSISEEYKDNFDIGRFYENDGSVAYAKAIRVNDEAMVERLRAIESAQDKIILSSYRLRADEAGKLYIASLVDAARRGVEIDIILDGNTLFVNAGKNNYYKALDSFDNVNIMIYNPIRITRPWSIMGRMHDKYMIVDDKIAFLGGRNIENRFLISDINQSYDWDMLVYYEKRGDNDAIEQLTDYFKDIYENGERNQWLNEAAVFASNKDNKKLLEELDSIYKTYKTNNSDNLTSKDYKQYCLPVDKVSLISNPVNVYTKEPQAFYEMTELMLAAKDEVKIHTPYYIGNDMMYERTKKIAENANTTLFTNSPANNANLVGAGDFLIHKKKFKDLGLRILLNSKSNSYHGKAFTIDDDISGLGSFNWDMRSVYIDTELMMVVCGKDFTREVKKEFAYYEDDATYVDGNGNLVNPSGEDYDEASFIKKFISVLFVILFYPLRFLF